MEQEESVWVENVPTSWMECFWESVKRPFFSVQCCRTAGIKCGQPDQGGHPSWFIRCSLSLLPNTKSPQRDIRGRSLEFSTTDHKSWDQRASGSSKGSAWQTVLAEWFSQRLIGSARGIRISFFPDVSVSLWLLPENKETFISVLKPLFPYKNLYFLIGQHPTSLLPFSRRAAQQTAEQLLSNNQSHLKPTCLRNECLCSVIMRRSYKAQDHLNHLETS